MKQKPFRAGEERFREKSQTSEAKPVGNSRDKEKGRSNWFEQRQRLVEDLKRRGITDQRVLAAMGKVPREVFVPEELRHLAYYNGPLAIGEGQTISQPYVVALMTQLLVESQGGPHPNPLLQGEGTFPSSDEEGIKGSLTRQRYRALEIGTGSGYQTAVLGEIFDEVYSVERISSLAQRARGVLKSFGYKNVHFRIADGSRGWPTWEKVTKGRGFDGVLVTAAAKSIPKALRTQVADGGRLVIPTESEGGQRLLRITRCGDEYLKEDFGWVAFVPLITGTIKS